MYLEAISLLSSRSAVPFHQVVVWAVQIFVQLYDKALEERRELTFHLHTIQL